MRKIQRLIRLIQYHIGLILVELRLIQKYIRLILITIR